MVVSSRGSLTLQIQTTASFPGRQTDGAFQSALFDDGSSSEIPSPPGVALGLLGHVSRLLNHVSEAYSSAAAPRMRLMDMSTQRSKERVHEGDA